jgi:hypothetical protein
MHLHQRRGEVEAGFRKHQVDHEGISIRRASGVEGEVDTPVVTGWGGGRPSA